MENEYFLITGNPRTLIEIKNLIGQHTFIEELCTKISLKNIPKEIRLLPIIGAVISPETKDNIVLEIPISNIPKDRIINEFIAPLIKELDLGQPNRTSLRKESIPPLEFEGTLLRPEDMRTYKHLDANSLFKAQYSSEELDKEAFLFLKEHINDYDYDLHTEALNYGLLNNTLCNDIKGALDRLDVFYVDFFNEMIKRIDKKEQQKEEDFER